MENSVVERTVKEYFIAATMSAPWIRLGRQKNQSRPTFSQKRLKSPLSNR
jgi:hypothetical protein